MENFEFKSQVCTDKNQSRKLLELGLKKETADMGLVYMTHDLGGKEIEPVYLGESIGLWECEERQTVLFSRQKQIPAWSLHRLLQIINRDMIIKPYTTFDDIIAYIEGLIKTQLIDWRYLEEDKQ